MSDLLLFRVTVHRAITMHARVAFRCVLTIAISGANVVTHYPDDFSRVRARACVFRVIRHKSG